MINFLYNKKIEDQVFSDFVLKKKISVVSDSIKNELSSVNIDSNQEFFINHIKFVGSEWKKVQPKFLSALGDFYEKDLVAPDLICYLTRLDIFPYKYSADGDEDNWFCAPMFGNPAERNRVIMHELCHYFQPVQLADEIKEAIPVILNDHEKFGMYSFDRGHQDESEQKWRKIIWDLYKNGGKFSDLLKLIK